MNAAKLELTILSYTQLFALMVTAAQKTSGKNSWSLIQSQTEIKARVEENIQLKMQLAKKTPV